LFYTPTLNDSISLTVSLSSFNAGRIEDLAVLLPCPDHEQEQEELQTVTLFAQSENLYTLSQNDSLEEVSKFPPMANISYLTKVSTDEGIYFFSFLFLIFIQEMFF